MLKPVFAALALLTAATLPAAAQAPKLIGVFDDWEAYTAAEDGKKICYMGSEPKKQEGDFKQRGRVVLLVTHRPSDKEKGVVSVTTGYTYKKDSKANAKVGDKGFDLFTDGGFAFAEAGKDADLVAAMIKGADLVVKGTSSRGTLTTDTYSLKGFTAAWKAIGQACDVK